MKPEVSHVNFARDPKYSWFHEHSNNWIYCLYLHFIIDIEDIEIIYNLGKKQNLHLICNLLTVLLECKTEKRNSQYEHRQPMGQTRGLFCTCDSGVARCQSQNPVSLLVNEFDVGSVLHVQVSLKPVNQIYVIHEAMNVCKNLKIHYRLALIM